MENKETMACSIMDEVHEMRRKISEEFGHDLSQLVAYYQELETEMRSLANTSSWIHRMKSLKGDKIKKFAINI